MEQYSNIFGDRKYRAHQILEDFCNRYYDHETYIDLIRWERQIKDDLNYRLEPFINLYKENDCLDVLGNDLPRLAERFVADWLETDLEPNGKYMAFAQRASTNDNYTTMLCFSRENTIYSEYGLHLGCDFYGHGNTLNNVRLSGVGVVYSGTWYNGYNGTIPIVTGIGSPSVSTSVSNVSRNSDNAITDFSINVNVTVNYNSTNIKVSNGIIVGY